MRSRSWVKAVALSAAALASGALTGCTPAAPTEIATPEIVWDAAAPGGEFADDPFAQAAYDAMLAFVLAVNANDFTISQLTATTTKERIAEIYEQHVAEYDDAADRIAWAGPLPRSVLSVEESENGAVVTMCDVSSGWYISEDHPAPTAEGVTPLPVRLILVNDDGALKLDEVRGGSGSCDGEGVAFGIFDPLPAPLDGAIRPPLD